MSTENKYFPFNEEQYIELKQKVSTIDMHLPDSMLSYVWNNYKLISGNVTEPQPCSCSSASGLWIKAVNSLKDYVKRIESI
jgi:hypothetical protein